MARKPSADELSKRLEATSAEVSRLHFVYTHKPDAEYRTGRIAGSDSRYSLRVWYRNCETLGVLVHHHPNQSDAIMDMGHIGDCAFNVRATMAHDDESHAISRLVCLAREGEFCHYRNPVAPPHRAARRFRCTGAPV